MPNPNANQNANPNPNPSPGSSNQANPPHHSSAWRRILFFLKFLEIRLRFVLILVITALVVGYWDNIQNYVERWQRNRAAAHVEGGAGGAADGHDHAGQNEFEFFCPMHPFVIRDHAGKCPVCGMDLVQRKNGAPMTLPEGTLARVQVSPERVMQAGIQIEPVAYRLLTRTVRSYGNIEPDETRLARITARFPGRIDELMVNAVGMTVEQGQALARIYSPKYLAATQEYAQALRAERQGAGGSGEGRLSELARRRLLLAGFTEEQIDNISADTGANSGVMLFSPLTGTVLEKSALLGETVNEGSSLYTIADLSRVWVQVQVIESELATIRAGMPVEVTTVAYPGEIFFGTVDFIYPTLDAANRSVKVRVVVDNTAGKLKPGMYVMAVMRSSIGAVEPLDAAAETTASTATAAPAPASASAPALPTQSQPDADRFIAGLALGAAYYQCPMDLEVVSNAPGECPKCGMDLEARANEGAAPAHEDHATTTTSPATVDPATALPTQIQADADRFIAGLAPGAEFYQCPMDLEVVSNEPGDCPKCGMHLEKQQKDAATAGTAAATGSAGATDPTRPSLERWAEGWSCPMHPDELSDKPGVCITCGCGMPLERIRVERVPSIPEMAVVDTGTRHVVYVETAPGIYDAREVTLGARAGAYYPVLQGLELGDRVVARGSFLIDAEARLNPATAGTASPDADAPQVAPAEHQHGG